MRAMVLDEWGGPMTEQERPTPEPGPGEALMQVRAAGVGLTLAHMRRGVFGGSTPRIMGHELAGDIVALGRGVESLQVGDRVGVYFYLNCGACKWCRGGRETLCENWKGFVGVHIDGGWAEYVSLPAQNLLVLPEGLDYEAAAIAADAVCTPWHACKERAQIKPLDDVLIIGAGGGVGIHGVQMAKHFGGRVIAVDISEEKLNLCREWGASEVIDANQEDVAEAVMRITDGKGVEAAIDFNGSPDTFQAAIASTGRGGRTVLIGAKPGEVTFPHTQLITEEKIVTGSRYSTKKELAETFELVARGIITPVIGRRLPFTGVESIFEDLYAERLLGRGALTYD